MPFRRIASNYLWTPEGLFAHPLVGVDAGGCIRSVDRCDDPDRLAGTEFYAGILLPGPTGHDGFAASEARPAAHPDPAGSVACGPSSEERRPERDAARRAGCGPASDGGDAGAAGLCAESGCRPPLRIRLSEGPVGPLLAGARPDRHATVVVDRTLSAQEADRIAAHFSAPVRWCLSFGLDEPLFCRMAELIRRRGPVCVVDGSPADPTRLARLALVQRRIGMPLHELLGWIAASAAAVPGAGPDALPAGTRCGLSVLSGLDYGSMLLTGDSRLRRIL